MTRLADFIADGLCAQTDPESFFPDRGGDNESRMAKRVCGECLVQETCLEWALPQWDLHGVWGGYTKEERYHLRKKAA